jgi:hypothetical protein
MLEAWQNQAVFVVEGLEPETGDHDTTVRNLSKLVKPERVVFGILNRSGHVLVIFSTGETYYAAGTPLRSRALADFLTRHSEGRWTTDLDLLHETLATWPLDGIVDLPA